jgi:RNA polymerase sigma factor (sigma-70 family)
MNNQPPDEALMAQVREGALERLAVLFDRYQLSLFNFFYRLLPDRQASEDMVQEVFFRILKYRHTYRADTAFRSWIFQIARNVRRDARPKPALVAVESEPIADPTASEPPHDAALMERALMALPEEKREILMMSRLQGLKHREIGEVLGCEAGAVKVRIHRALKELRAKFQELESPASGLSGRVRSLT